MMHKVLQIIRNLQDIERFVANKGKTQMRGALKVKTRPMALTLGSVLMMGAISACGASPASATQPTGYKAGAINRQYAGTTITVLVPPYAGMPQSQLAKFTKKTGIKVKMETLAWADIHDKIVTAEASHISPADVTEVDWSWVGQFAQAGWYTPLNKYIAPNYLKNAINRDVFTIHHQLLAMPYNFGFKETTINWTDFQKAGITTVPTSWAQVLQDAKILKKKGVVQYPVGFPLSIGESNSTNWYALIKSAGGELFSAKWVPQFTAPSSPGYQALAFEKALYQGGLMPPGVVSLHNIQVQQLFAAGQIAIALTSGPLFMSMFKNPSTSKVAGDNLKIIPLPGNDGHRTGTFGLPEGLGIPKLSTHKGAAAEFINWWMEKPQLLVSYNDPNMGNPPPQIDVLHQLSQTHKIQDGPEIMSILPTVKPLFPQGTPVWYPQFSTDAATMIQSVVEGHVSVKAGVKTLASQARQMAQSAP